MPQKKENLRKTRRIATPVALTAIALALAACGGGSTETPSAATPDAGLNSLPRAVTLSGVAASGAPMAGATIKVFDATGATVCDTTAGTDGSYRCELGASPKAPFVMQAEIGDIKLMSAFGEAKSGTVNITPITHLIAATLAADGNPDTLIANLSGGSAFTPETLQTALAKVTEALKPLTDALGATIDPISGSFQADGTGYDKVLDALQVSVRPNGESSNIEVTVKTMPTSEDAAPVSISFQSNASTIPPLPQSIDLGDVGATNVQTSIADFLARATECFALPTAERVSNGQAQDSEVIAEACRSMFSDNDPSTFLSNGQRIAPNQSFAGLFRDGGTGIRFDNGVFAFFRVNGDWVVSYKITDTQGNVTPEQIVLRNENGTLRAIGNQYQYNAAVRPIVQLRDHLNQPEASSLSTGYNISIANRVDGQGNPVFDRVLVTTPRGNTLVYRPTSGLSYLVIDRGGVSGPPTLSGTPLVRLAGKLVNPGLSMHPADVDTSLFYADRNVFTEEAIRAIPDQSVWKLAFFHAGNTGATPDVVQTYRTTTRAMTLAEASQVKWVTLTADSRAAIQQESSATGNLMFSDPPDSQQPQYAYLEGDGGTGLWTVPSGALAPTGATLYGRAPSVNNTIGARYNDSVSFPASARRATIRCSAQSVGDQHCAPDPLRDQYATGSMFNLIELYARDARQTDVSAMFALYRLTIQPQ